MNTIEASLWLDDGLLALLLAGGEMPDPSGSPVRAGFGGEPIEVRCRWLACAEGRWLLTTAPPMLAEGALVELTLGEGDGAIRIGGESIEQRRCAAARFAVACGERLDPAGRTRAMGFLADAPWAHQIDCTHELCERLREIRDVLRPALPVSKVAPGVRSAMRLDQVVRVDERAFWLVGWLRASDLSTVRLTAVSPEGARAATRNGAVSFHPRPDIGKLFAGDAIPTTGFAAYVELDVPSRHPTGWVLELRDATGAAIEDSARKPVVEDVAELGRLLRKPPVSNLSERLFANQLLPTLVRLSAVDATGTIEEILDYGPAPQAPDVSIVIATAAIDRIEHQLIEFARDPGMAGVELIYVVPRAKSDELHVLVEGLSALHRIALRVVRVSPAARRTRTVNLGVAVARGRLLVLMGGDVLATERGWLEAMHEFYDSNPAVGALGPMLAHEDGSIASAGISYVRTRRPGSWKRSEPHRGLSTTLPAVAAARSVQAVTDACMMVAADDFRTAGGLCELYLEDRDVAGDFCLGLAESELEAWYFPGARLHVLERDTWPGDATPAAGAFDSWLFDTRRGKRLARSLAPEPPGAATAAVAPRQPQRADADAPVELVEVIPLELGGGRLLDGAVQAPPVGSPYDGTYSFAIEGWALARDGSRPAVEVSGAGLSTRRTVADLSRPEVAARYPDMPGADASGFRFVLGSLPLPADFELTVEASFDDDHREPLARVRGRRRLRSSYAPAFQPLLITSTGRTGSLWLQTLLSRHPEIIGYQPFETEPSLAGYWASTLAILAEPRSYMQMILPQRTEDDRWIIGDARTISLPLWTSENEMPRWLGREHIEQLAILCQSQVDAFYHELTRVYDRPAPRYFVEKCAPTPARMVRELYPDGGEIFLIRDLRDRVCSILDYNSKRGFALWGREGNPTDKEWFRYLRDEASDLLAGWRERRERAHLVRYEDLIADPQATLTAVLSHLGLDAGFGTVRGVIADAAKTAPASQAFHRTSSSFADSVGRWKRDLSQARQRLCAELFDDIQAEFGYQPTEVQTGSPDDSRSAALTAQDG